MTFERSPLRYAHTNGYTGFVYTADGEIITCGTEGDIRLWKGVDDDDPKSFCFGDFVYGLAHGSNKLYVSTDRNLVQECTYPRMERGNVITRFTAPVTSLCINELCLVAGSEDTYIKIIKDFNTNTVIELNSHSGPILGLDISRKGLIASIGGDGNLKIWNFEDGSEIKNFSGFTKANCFENALYYRTIAFEPIKGNSLVYVKEKVIHILNATSWNIEYTMSDENINGNYTCCSYSSDGVYLAAGTDTGYVSIFDIQCRKLLRCEEPPSDCHRITCIMWNPKNNKELAFCDCTGQLGTIFQVITGVLDLTENTKIEECYSNSSDQNDGESLRDYIEKDDVSIEMQNTQSICSEDHSIVAKKMFKQQTSFQPSATPNYLEHRYLVWNDVGIVTSHTNTSDGSIDVEFHDASVHHSLHIPNYSNYNIASLSTTILALSAVGSSKIVCISLAATDKKEWSTQMPSCEYVELLVATNKIVGVVTNKQFLRLFTILGTQREIISITGPPITIAGFENKLIICYHGAPSSEKHQHLEALLIETKNLSLRAKDIKMPLLTGREIVWLGFSECGSPCLVDSMGLVMLFSNNNNYWFPICDTMAQSASVSNHYFVISISETRQIIQAILCQGTSYPMTNPRPTLQELPICLPVCDPDTEKSELEDRLLRSAIMKIDDADKILKEAAIKLFALACRNEAELKAKELIETIGCTDLLSLAVKYSSKSGRLHLSDRLTGLTSKMDQSNQCDFSGGPKIAFSPSSSNSVTSLLVQAPTLAPKIMKVSLEAKASLKRFSLLKGSKDLKQTYEDNQSNTVENMSSSECESSNSKDVATNQTKAVNPFARKRKLWDI